MQISYLLAKLSRERGACGLIRDGSACSPYGPWAAIVRLGGFRRNFGLSYWYGISG